MFRGNPFSKKYRLEASYDGENWNEIGELVHIPSTMPEEYAKKIRRNGYNMHRVVDKRTGNVVLFKDYDNRMSLV